MHYALLFSLFLGCSAPLQIQSDLAVARVDHTTWDHLLKKHVDTEGNVDYKNFASDTALLDGYLKALAENPIANDADKNEKLAYYINLYNAGTVKLILDNYPLTSIKNIFRPWGKEWITIGKDTYSLGDIEHKILRRMDEPRIHFAINCASYSCPRLWNRAFTASQLETQLEKAAREFVNDPKRNKILSQKVQVSEIFKWFKKDFTKRGSLVDYLNRYSETDIDKKAKINYLDYDWSLNEAK